MITILLADDHKVVRQGVRALLEYEPDFEVIGEAGDGVEALEFVERNQPDILLTDLSMPGCSGIDLACAISKKHLRTKVVILSMHGDQPYIAKAMACGALGYVLKEVGVEHIVQAIRESLKGRRYVSPPLVLPPL
jgi:DNA-binding NarL/FixJ family response regulator